MRRIVAIASCLLLALSFASVSKADVEADFWANVLGTINPATGNNFQAGEQIRLVFVTSAVAVPNDMTNPAVWNNLLQPPIANLDAYYQNFAGTAATGGLLTGAQSFQGAAWNPLTNSTTSSALGAAQAGDIASKIGASGTTLGDMAVFNSAGQLVVDKSFQMLGAAASLHAGVRFDESGDDQAAGGSAAVWTGSDVNGFGASLGIPAAQDARLNAAAANNRQIAAIGDAGATTASWLSAAASGQGTDDGAGHFFAVDRSIYVMSDDVTVVPEPSTVLLWLGFTGAAGLVYWRKRRR